MGIALPSGAEEPTGRKPVCSCSGVVAAALAVAFTGWGLQNPQHSFADLVSQAEHQHQVLFTQESARHACYWVCSTLQQWHIPVQCVDSATIKDAVLSILRCLLAGVTVCRHRCGIPCCDCLLQLRTYCLHNTITHFQHSEGSADHYLQDVPAPAKQSAWASQSQSLIGQAESNSIIHTLGFKAEFTCGFRTPLPASGVARALCTSGCEGNCSTCRAAPEGWLRIICEGFIPDRACGEGGASAGPCWPPLAAGLPFMNPDTCTPTTASATVCQLGSSHSAGMLTPYFLCTRGMTQLMSLAGSPTCVCHTSIAVIADRALLQGNRVEKTAELEIFTGQAASCCCWDEPGIPPTAM